MKFATSVIAAAFIVMAPATAHADIVSDWYETEIAALKAGDTGDYMFDPETAQSASKLALAMFEAADSIDRKYASYLKLAPAAKGASLDAAVDTAAHAVMLKMHPNQKMMIDQAYAVAIARVPAGKAREDGVAAGMAAATAALAAGGLDPALPLGAYRPNGAPGKFVPVSIPFDPRTVQMRRWFLKSADEFRPGPPVALTSPEWARAVNEVKSVGAKNSKVRSEADTVAARFWANYALAPTLRQIADQPGRSVVANARMYAMLEMGSDDTGVALVEGKLHYGFWRPLSAIRGAADSGNDAIMADATWVPLLRTPPQPEYPCGHCVFAGFVAAVLSSEGPPPPAGIHFTSDSMAGVSMTVSDWPAFVLAVSNSRINGGVHFRTTNDVSMPIGTRIGEAVRARFAPPVK